MKAMYEKLTERQKNLLRDIVEGVRSGKVFEPIQTSYTLSSVEIIGIEKEYDLSLKGDLQVLENEDLLSTTYSHNGEKLYTLLQTSYDAVDNNFQEPIKKEIASGKIFKYEAFIICAFQEELNPICEIIKSASIRNNVNARRVDDYEEDYKITDKILSKIQEAKIIIADLSFERPNVYFEYGYARGVGRTGSIITIIRKGHTTHFDVKDWNQIIYNPDNLEDLENKLDSRIKALLNKIE